MLLSIPQRKLQVKKLVTIYTLIRLNKYFSITLVSLAVTFTAGQAKLFLPHVKFMNDSLRFGVLQFGSELQVNSDVDSTTLTRYDSIFFYAVSTVYQIFTHNLFMFTGKVKITMASSSLNASNKSTGSGPFDWLGGVFGKSKGGSENLDSNVKELFTGIQTNLEAILRPTTGTVPARSASDTASNEASADPSLEIDARLARVRSLLYDERRLTSSSLHENGSGRQRIPAVAGAALQTLTSDSHCELMPRLVACLDKLPFESRKQVAAIFNYLLVCGLEGIDREMYVHVMQEFVRYVQGRYVFFMNSIVTGHEATAGDVALHYGSMYRSCLRQPTLYKELVGTSERVLQYVCPFLDTYVHLPNFDVSSDAMESLRLAITAGGERVTDEESQQFMAELAADFLTRDYDVIWEQRFNPKLLADSAKYMTRRVALQILSTVLLTRSNYSVMIQYVASRQNLILVMKLLRDQSPHITLDAFHVFKVFVANPKKLPEVIKILRDNKVKLCQYLRTLHSDREANDVQFRDEKALIIATIEEL
jgi:calcium binding protein 39